MCRMQEFFRLVNGTGTKTPNREPLETATKLYNKLLAISHYPEPIS